MAADEKVAYCQVDAHLDSNPKIRKGGRDARDVFEFVLRRVAIARAEGFIPLKYVEPWYLADQLMCTEDEARNGMSRAVTAALLAIDEVAGVVRVVGWSPEWGRRPKSNAERQSEFRERNYSKSDDRVTGSNGESHDVTKITQERRGEEKRSEKNSAQNSAQPSAGGFFGDLESESPRPVKPARSSKLDPTAVERGSAIAVLASLGARNGVSYSAGHEHVRLIASRLRDGCSESDLLFVVAYCADKLSWARDPDMQKYLRPETLFGPRTIAKYLDPARAAYATRTRTPQDSTIAERPLNISPMMQYCNFDDLDESEVVDAAP